MTDKPLPYLTGFQFIEDLCGPIFVKSEDYRQKKKMMRLLIEQLRKN